MFIDCVIIKAVAGDGGNGCRSFRREAFVPRGGPDGGDGGRGGDIVFEVDRNVSDLSRLKFAPLLKGKHGGHGRGGGKHGRSAPEVVVKIPPGTVVYRLPDATETGESGDQGLGGRPDPERDGLPVVTDLVEEGRRFVLCRGGKGGRGNARFKSATNRAPTEFESGGEGQAGRFFLELKMIADVGLVGFPNAGKSTLLRAISAARPKVAPYPFTTLEPHLGIVEMGETWQRYTVADVPGLVEGAHRGVGLGHEFLRHIERCRTLLFVLDVAGSEGRDAGDDFRQLREELKRHGRGLAEKAFMVVANKMDLPSAEAGLKAFRRRHRCRVMPVSSERGDGIEPLKEELGRWVRDAGSRDGKRLEI
ncbi:MAG: GTPase ObgE [Verrucomicrobiae bacterium]|nr:GTPase ObgE [Verrucomicrobiae bacterium]